MDRVEAEQIAQWLRNEGHEGYFLDFDPDQGLSAGKRWEEEIYQRLGLSTALLAVVTPNWLRSKWCFTEVALARKEGKQVLLVKVAPCETSDLFPDIQHVDATTNQADAFRLLARSLKEAGIDAEERFVWDRSRPIYPGLTAFREEDAGIFFGRDSAVRAGIERLARLSGL